MNSCRLHNLPPRPREEVSKVIWWKGIEKESKLRVRSLEDLLGAFWSPAILKPLCLRGQEWKERFAKESCGAVKGFPLRFPTLQVSTYLWNRGGSLILRCQGGRRRPQVEATDALIIQLTPCCQSVLAVMLAKAGVSVGFTYYWIEPMTLAV
ncbi:hypothetical protein KY290_025131 [Solanum tuberosum]|uniref:Uncharacterized protein n=1 Tax=Solanum tuberosum TaxID=4113 RepID=A0ABQ7USM4_SOLTU|nr:hypothetical protein KY290_025131 [Solanum tuberosum]